MGWVPPAGVERCFIGGGSPPPYNCSDEEGDSISHVCIFHSAGLHDQPFRFRQTTTADAQWFIRNRAGQL